MYFPMLSLILLSLFVSPPKAKTHQFFVSVTGNDTNAGTKSAPFASVAAAQKAARAFKKLNPDVGIKVLITPGIYDLKHALVFNAEDGGTKDAPVTYTSTGNEAPVFTGGKTIVNWVQLRDSSVLNRLDNAVRHKIYAADISGTGITDLGDPTEPGRRPELFCNNILQTLARWPNAGFAVSGKVKGNTVLPPTYIKVNGTKEGVFEYTDATKNKWADEDDVRICGYFYWDWAEGFQQVKQIDTIAKVITLNEPYHHYGYKDGFRYFGLNILSELDSAGEWYLDRKQGMLYWYPPAGIEPGKADVVLSVFSEDFMVTLKDCAYLDMENLAFRETRGSGIHIQDGNNCRIKDCRLERIGRDGVRIDSGKAHTITGNYLAGMGFGGIKVYAGSRKNLIHSEHVIDNNIVEHFSLFKRTYEPAVHFAGCGITIRHNRFRYSSSSAMRLDGNDMLVEFNQVSFVVNESDDQGAVDMFFNPSYRGNIFRYNYWSDIAGGTRHGAAGIRLDDMISGTLIYGNVFERCGVLNFGAVQIHGGKENVVDNNVFYKCNAAVSFSPWSKERWLAELESERMKKMLYEDVDINAPVYTNRYPDIRNLKTGINENSIKNNLIIDCKTDYIRIDKSQQLSNNTTIASQGLTVMEYCETATLKKYGMQSIPLKEIGIKKNKWLSLSN